LESALIICQHYPVVTLGRRASRENILLSDDQLRAQGIELHVVDRGGDVTYHGPGQLTAYPIFNLNLLRRDVHFFLRQLEEVAINTLSDFNVRACRLPGLTGAWVDNQKIASIGIAVRHWITYHGLSINVQESDVDNFYLIRPCGMDIEVTALERKMREPISTEEVKPRLLEHFKRIFALEYVDDLAKDDQPRNQKRQQEVVG
jgi:lipoate-protein ligase B